jgi:hypothetical protein
MASPAFLEFVKYRKEASYAAAAPQTASGWNIGGNGGGATGWFELPVLKTAEAQPKSPLIYPMTKSGQRHMHVALPVAGSNPPEQIGSYEFPIYPVLCDRLWLAAFGTVVRTETAGVAALASTAFASVATLDTQPATLEIFKFVIASSTAASAAVINIIQSGVTVETITIGTNAGTVNGSYYSKGAYDGSVNAITFSIAGTVTLGMVVVSGIKYVSNVFTIGNTTPSLVFEQSGRLEAGSGNSEYFAGCVVPTIALNYARTDQQGLLMGNATILGQKPANATAGTFANDAALYYRPYAAWTASLTLGGSPWLEVQAMTITISPNTGLYEVSSGTQSPTGKIEGEFAVTGEITLLPADNARFADYQAATVRDVNLIFTSPYMVNASTPYSLTFELPQLSLGDYTRTQVAVGEAIAQGATAPFTGIYDSGQAGAVRMTSVDRLPI